MLSDEVRDLVAAYKFMQAKLYLTPEATPSEKATISALADVFGNPGWTIGGALDKVIEAAVSHVLEDPVDVNAIRAEMQLAMSRDDFDVPVAMAAVEKVLAEREASRT